MFTDFVKMAEGADEVSGDGHDVTYVVKSPNDLLEILLCYFLSRNDCVEV